MASPALSNFLGNASSRADQTAKMKVVFYNHTGQVSGAERMLLLSIANLPSESFHSTVVCPEDGPLKAEVTALGAEWHAARILRARFTRNPYRLAKYVLSIAHTMLVVRKTLRALSPDLVHANSVRAGIVATLATAGTRLSIVWHVHDILPRHFISALVRFLARMSRRTHIVACSRAAARSFERNPNGDFSSVTVIHNGIDTTKFRCDPSVGRSARAELGVNSGDFVIGIVGQVAPRKGQLGLIRAFSKLLAEVPNGKLLVIGGPLFNRDHEYLSKLREEVTRLCLEESVLFLGHRKDAAAVMQALDILVLNSLVEPFALVLLEAMMMGKPVLATDSGGPAEVIQHGVNGHLVPADDTEALTAALAELIRNPALRRKYVERARDDAERFSIDSYMAKLQAFYAMFQTGPKQIHPESQVAR
jgi:glycosyltransferase involved in cell wall biosynthesis